MGAYCYILRYTCQPGFHEDQRLDDLVKFCKTAQVEEVMFMIAPEEFNTGHITIEEAGPWIDLICRAKTRLAKDNIAVSLNPWTTLLHLDRGRKLKENQNFTTMVDPKGKKSDAVACPLCPEFKKYLTGIYSHYGSQIKPETIWVEDDFRLHNHDPLEWGGCFCQLHLKAFSEMVGSQVTRQELVENILAVGKPHPYRKAWLKLSRDTMLKLASVIEKAIHSGNPATNIGLMSSKPAVHCAEYRDWKALFERFAPNGKYFNRPHLPGYTEESPGQFLWNFSKITPYTQVFLPAETTVYPEIDSFSHSRFNISKSFMRLELLLSLSAGATGITINTDMTGNGVYLEEKYQDFLSQIKPFLNKAVSLDLSHAKQQGVRVLVNCNASDCIETTAGKTMNELYPDETFWASFLSCFGIANKFSCSTEMVNEIIAVSGQYLRNLDDQEIINLFENNRVLVDGWSASILHERQLGKLAGIEKMSRLQENTGVQCYEQICDGRNYYGISQGRISAQMCAGDAFDIDYSGPVEIRSELNDMHGKRVANGLAIYNDNVIIFPYCRSLSSHFVPGGNMPNIPLKQLTPIRQAFLKQCLRDIEPSSSKLTYTTGSPFLAIYRYDDDSRVILLIVNSTSDDLDSVTFYLNDKTVEYCKVFDSGSCDGRQIKLHCEDKIHTLRHPLKAMDAILVVIE